MPRSVLLGRAHAAGEPLFLPEDTDAVIALAEEERDTCGLCGLPKAWCRDNATGRARFTLEESYCWATRAVNERKHGKSWQKKDADHHHAYVLSPRFREGHEPPVDAGLSIAEEV